MKIMISGVIGFVVGVIFAVSVMGSQETANKTEVTPERVKPGFEFGARVEKGPFTRYLVTSGFNTYTDYIGEAEAWYDREVKSRTKVDKYPVALIQEDCTQKVLKGHLGR